MVKSVHLLIKGKVQGVFYRASAREEAERLGINGWVKNTRDGSVEAMAEGPEEAVSRFIAWCRQGPPRAVVSEVAVTESAPGAYPGFSVLR
jgi:acylphosphatase